MRALIWIAAILFIACVLLLAYGATHSTPKTYGAIAAEAEKHCLGRQESMDMATNAAMPLADYCRAYGRMKATQIFGEDHRDFQ